MGPRTGGRSASQEVRMKRPFAVVMVTLFFTLSCCLLGVPKPPSVNIPIPQINITPQVKVGPEVTPGFTTQYVLQMYQLLFSYTFGVGGCWIWTGDFRPGDWTKWEITVPEGEKIIVEMAYLKLTPDGNQWWRIGYYPYKEGEEPLIYEGMFSSNMGQLRRLRAKFGDEEPREIPVTEGTYVARPVKLTKESVEGAKVGVETVTVPAGTYRAEHIRYGSVTGGTIEWWTSGQVPGGVVKYLIRDKNEKLVLQSELFSFGSGAGSVLGSF